MNDFRLIVYENLITTSRVRYIIINTRLSLDFLYFSKNWIWSKINHDRFYFSQIYEMSINFSSSFRDMVYDYYLKPQVNMWN